MAIKFNDSENGSNMFQLRANTIVAILSYTFVLLPKYCNISPYIKIVPNGCIRAIKQHFVGPFHSILNVRIDDHQLLNDLLRNMYILCFITRCFVEILSSPSFLSYKAGKS